MLNHSFILLFLCINLKLSSTYKVNDEILSVVVIFRHGDRTILFPYPRDPYFDEKYWPEGLCQLTDVGKNQCFMLGKWLRQRYNKFLPAKYNAKDIYFRSTNRERTILSGAYVAAGIYEVPKKSWTLVPIHSRPILNDNFLLMRSPCPKYDKEKDKVFQNSPFKEIHMNHRELFEFLADKTGKTVSTVDDILKIYDTLKIERKRKLAIPEWGRELYPKLKNLSLFSLSSEVYNNQMARLKTGLILNWILEHFEHITDQKTMIDYMDFYDDDYRSQKFVVFCGHDHVIVNILQTFGLYDMKWPHVSSALIFEYRETENYEKYVNFLYKNSSDQAAQLCLKNCHFNCPFEQFKALVEPFALNEDTWYRECCRNPYIDTKFQVTDT